MSKKNSYEANFENKNNESFENQSKLSMRQIALEKAKKLDEEIGLKRKPRNSDDTDFIMNILYHWDSALDSVSPMQLWGILDETTYKDGGYIWRGVTALLMRKFKANMINYVRNHIYLTADMFFDSLKYAWGSYRKNIIEKNNLGVEYFKSIVDRNLSQKELENMGHEEPGGLLVNLSWWNGCFVKRANTYMVNKSQALNAPVDVMEAFTDSLDMSFYDNGEEKPKIEIIDESAKDSFERVEKSKNKYEKALESTTPAYGFSYKGVTYNPSKHGIVETIGKEKISLDVSTEWLQYLLENVIDKFGPSAGEWMLHKITKGRKGRVCNEAALDDELIQQIWKFIEELQDDD